MSDLFKHALLSQPGFSAVSDEALNILASISRRRKLERGKLLFQRGDASNELFVVTKGSVKLSVVSGDGVELVLRYANENTLLGEVGVLGNRARPADARAAEDLELYSLEKTALFRCFARYPEIAAALFQCLCDRICATTDQLEGLALFSLESRVARLFLKLAKEKQSAPDQGFVRVPLPYSQTEIAEMVSGSRQQVNRAIKKLENRNFIRKNVNKNWFISIELLEEHLLKTDFY